MPSHARQQSIPKPQKKHSVSQVPQVPHYQNRTLGLGEVILFTFGKYDLVWEGTTADVNRSNIKDRHKVSQRDEERLSNKTYQSNRHSNAHLSLPPVGKKITHPETMILKYQRFQSPNQHNNMKILICPSGFKESLEPQAVADCMEAGILRVLPDATITKVPLVDGGEGFVKTLVATTKGVLIPLTVTGPICEPIPSYFGFLGGKGPKTAIVEMAAAAGLRLVPHNHRDPSRTTTYGVGELIAAALEAGAERILIGCGDSGTCDGGVGMAQALGARFNDSQGDAIPIASGGQALTDLAAVDLTNIHPLLQEVPIDVACNWKNVLCGREGVARVFGPQKGATEAEVERLSIAMDNCARVIGGVVGRDIAQAPGSGASGGLGAGLMLIGARLQARYEIISKFLNMDELLNDCDLVFTAEGCLDSQTPQGKIPAEVAVRAKKRGLPVIALAGSIGQNADVNYDIGIDAFASIMQSPTSLEVAISKAEKLLTDSAEATMRIVMVGRSLEMRQGRTEESTPPSVLPGHSLSSDAVDASIVRSAVETRTRDIQIP